MLRYTADDVVLALEGAPVDPRTGNKVLYSVAWKADKPSMIGNRNEDWVRREIDWFTSGSDNLSDMEDPVPQAFQACADETGTVNSAYGHILFSDEVGSPTLYQRIVNTFLTEGAETRHSVAIISDRDIHNLAVKDGRKDFICTNALNVMIDHEGALHIIAQMRSMDAVWGYRADWSMWDALMEKLLYDLGLLIPDLHRGDIIFQVANLHVYPRHFDLLNRWADKVNDELERLARRQWMDRVLRDTVEGSVEGFNATKTQIKGAVR